MGPMRTTEETTNEDDENDFEVISPVDAAAATTTSPHGDIESDRTSNGTDTDLNNGGVREGSFPSSSSASRTRRRLSLLALLTVTVCANLFVVLYVMRSGDNDATTAASSTSDSSSLRGTEGNGGDDATSSPVASPSMLSVPNNNNTPTLAPTLSSSPTAALSWTMLPDVDGAAIGEEMGRVVALSGDGSRLAVGGAGACRLYESTDGGLTYSSNVLYSFFPDAGGTVVVALTPDGTRLAVADVLADANDVSGAGAVTVLRSAGDGGVWSTAGNADATKGTEINDALGTALALSDDGRRLVAGTDGRYAKVFDLVGGDDDGAWRLVDRLYMVGVNFGRALDLDGAGATLAVGASFYDGDRGAVIVYGIADGDASTTRPTVLAEEFLEGAAEDDRFGSAVAVSGNGRRLAAASAGTDRVGTWRKNDDGVWTASPVVFEGDARSRFGYSLSLSADGAALSIGAPFARDEDGAVRGRVVVYRLGDDLATSSTSSLGFWGEAPGDLTGWSVALSGDGRRLAAGAKRNDGAGGRDSGHVRVYRADRPAD